MGRIQEALSKAKAERRQDVVDHDFSTHSDLRQGQSHPEQSRMGKSELSNIPPSHVLRLDNKKLQEQRVIAASQYDERVGPYRQLRTQLLKTMRDNDWTTLAITSAHERAGKTVTAANLAISLARDVNTTVLLVDLDLNTPTVHKKLNLHSEKGLVDFLQDQAQLSEILFDPGIQDLTILAGRSAGVESSELLASPKMKELIQDLCQQEGGSITIFDLPPLLRNDDAILFAPFADATLVVVEDGVTTKEQLQQALRLLEKANVIGTIINKART
jgi:capsular exopolysaccharide synthesis family protein